MPAQLESPSEHEPQWQGLTVGLCEAAMTQCLRAHLHALGGDFRASSDSLRSCRIVRVRHRQDVRAVIQYELQFSEGLEDSYRTLAVTGYLYAGTKAASVHRRMTRDAHCVDATQPIPTISYLAELQKLLLAFPLDRNLPALENAVHELPAAYHAIVRSEISRNGARIGNVASVMMQATAIPPRMSSRWIRGGSRTALRAMSNIQR